VQVAVVVVSYNTRDLLRACLRALLDDEAAEAAGAAGAAPPTGPALARTLLVVDNGSADGSAAMVRAEFPRVTLLEAGENLGYTRANNLALRLLGLIPGPPPDAQMSGPAPLPGLAPEFVWLLNPDTEVQPGALATLVQALLDAPAAAACGPRLVYGDGRFQHGAFGWPGVAQVALDLLPIHRLPGAQRLYGGRLNGRYAQRLWQGRAPFAVDFVLGAALLARAESLRSLGGLDEGYFMYCEEMDWCLRAHAAGWSILAVPQALVVHHEGQSSRQVRWASVERLWRSRLRFYARHRAHFGPLTLPAVRALLRWEMRRGIVAARRRFARGATLGTEAGEEIAARRTLLTL
jgi:GT2 family glycosyltransferase